MIWGIERRGGCIGARLSVDFPKVDSFNNDYEASKVCDSPALVVHEAYTGRRRQAAAIASAAEASAGSEPSRVSMLRQAWRTVAGSRPPK
jgi:hypothetical protein